MTDSTDPSITDREISKIVFIDTMVFLHFQSFDQLDWPAILNAKQVKVVVPAITIREINKHKDSHSLQKIRERAQTVIRKLFDLFKDASDAGVRRGVDIR